MRFALIANGHVENKVEAVDAAALVAAYPAFAHAYINLANVVPEPNAGDAFSFDLTMEQPVFTARVPITPVVDLGALKAQASIAIDAACAVERERYGTNIAFQSNLYAFKYQEVQRYVANNDAGHPELNTADVLPFMFADIDGRTRARQALDSNAPAATLLEVGTETVEVSNGWLAIFAALETHRAFLHERIRLTDSVDVVQAIMDAPNYPRFEQ